MTFTAVCSCGASVTVKVWGVRELDGLEGWFGVHAKCAAAWQQAQQERPDAR